MYVCGVLAGLITFMSLYRRSRRAVRSRDSASSAQRSSFSWYWYAITTHCKQHRDLLQAPEQHLE